MNSKNTLKIQDIQPCKCITNLRGRQGNVSKRLWKSVSKRLWKSILAVWGMGGEGRGKGGAGEKKAGGGRGEAGGTWFFVPASGNRFSKYSGKMDFHR
jgi:hypothetical protein